MGRLVDQLSLSLAIARISIGFQTENQGLQGPHEESFGLPLGLITVMIFGLIVPPKKAESTEDIGEEYGRGTHPKTPANLLKFSGKPLHH